MIPVSHSATAERPVTPERPATPERPVTSHRSRPAATLTLGRDVRVLAALAVLVATACTPGTGGWSAAAARVLPVRALAAWVLR